MGEATTASPLFSGNAHHLKFIIPPPEAESLARSHGFPSVSDFLPTLVHLARPLARVPVSSFPVCAAALASDGTLFLGVNLEFPHLPLHHSVHAEQFLLTSLALRRQPRPHLLTIVVSAFPCGHCRQFLQEIRSAPDIRILVPPPPGSPPTTASQPLSFLLPNRFGPDDLLDKDVPLILESHIDGLQLRDDLSDEDGRKELAAAALDAANGSHAPYSGCPSGVALVDVNGRVYKGSYMESAAYNPSMGPAQAAVVAFLAGGGSGYDRIVKAALTEKEDAVVRQEETVRLFFKTVVPDCEFHVFHCRNESKLV